MNSIVQAALIMGGLGSSLASVLAVAYRSLRIEEDPRIDEVEGMLPKSNCGACGQPGCRALAEKVVNGELPPSKCSVSSPEGVERIAAYLGVDAGKLDRLTARLHCAGGASQARQAAEYTGLGSCRAAALVAGGGKGCAWGCLGLADCEVSCAFGAITMNADHLPVVDPRKCTACGDCVKACPRNLFELLPQSKRLLVQCRAPLSGDDARAVCKVACDACGRCAADAPGLVSIVNNLAVVDYASALTQSPQATKRCPTGAIVFLDGGAQFAADRPVVPVGVRNVG